jgi:tRNA nucleotidyltransferase (CCA-adding enzyme)
MRRDLNLTADIKTYLPAEMVSFLDQAGRLAADNGQHLYLVGGVVRDLLLHRPNFDLDLVVEGDALPLARKLEAMTGAKLVVHTAFRTANLRWDKWSVDLVTARSETYRRPGALPTVQPGSLMSDLYRRDFAINAMAVDLDPRRFGKLVDYLGGWADLYKRQIRVMHNDSFIDDATRIWRAIRYEQRLGFHLEAATRRLLIRDILMLETISKDRIRHELEAVFREEYPEKVLCRAARLGVLAALHPSLRADRWLALKFSQARAVNAGQSLPLELYYALLGYRLTLNEAEQLIDKLRLSRTASGTMTDTIGLKTRLDTLRQPGLSRSKACALLEEYPAVAVTANLIATGSSTTRRWLKLYLDQLCHVKPLLTGNDLQKMGIPPGPAMKAVLREVLNARLDGKAKTREDEIAAVKAWRERTEH